MFNSQFIAQAEGDAFIYLSHAQYYTTPKFSRSHRKTESTGRRISSWITSLAMPLIHGRM
jgi:hypothetical protein